MEKNEIKKKLYRENPMADIDSIRKDGILYGTSFDGSPIYFLIPLGEVGEVIWQPEMPAKHLIRWLQ